MYIWRKKKDKPQKQTNQKPPITQSRNYAFWLHKDQQAETIYHLQIIPRFNSTKNVCSEMEGFSFSAANTGRSHMLQNKI